MLSSQQFSQIIIELLLNKWSQPFFHLQTLIWSNSYLQGEFFLLYMIWWKNRKDQKNKYFVEQTSDFLPVWQTPLIFQSFSTCLLHSDLSWLDPHWHLNTTFLFICCQNARHDGGLQVTSVWPIIDQQFCWFPSSVCVKWIFVVVFYSHTVNWSTSDTEVITENPNNSRGYRRTLWVNRSDIHIAPPLINCVCASLAS